MPAPKGNEFWRMAKNPGRKPIFANPEELWDACCGYFQWNEENPLEEEKAFCYQGEVVTHNAEKLRAMTIGMLCLYLGITRETWYLYKKREEFIDITTHVEVIIREQKFTGAAAELLNPNIIARDLGLADKRDVKADVTLNDILGELTSEPLVQDDDDE